MPGINLIQSAISSAIRSGGAGSIVPQQVSLIGSTVQQIKPRLPTEASPELLQRRAEALAQESINISQAEGLISRFTQIESARGALASLVPNITGRFSFGGLFGRLTKIKDRKILQSLSIDRQIKKLAEERTKMVSEANERSRDAFTYPIVPPSENLQESITRARPTIDDLPLF